MAGVIYNAGMFVRLNNAIFNNNEATRGAVIQTSADLIILNSKFENNVVTHSLGVINVANGNVNISKSTFNSNTGSDEGGVIFNNGGTVLIDESKFTSNRALSYGGAIDNAGQLTIMNSLFDKNQAYGAGAIDNGGNLTIIKSNFTNNVATKNGGAIDNNNILNIVGSIFENNIAGGEGGAIIARKDMNLSYSSLFGNKASSGSAIYVNNLNSNITTNWWGSNNPNFDELVNRNVSDWITINLKNKNSLMQYEKASFTISFKMASKNAVSALDSLPNIKITLSNIGNIYAKNGIISKSVVIPAKSSITAKINGQTFNFKTVKNPSKITGNKNVAKDYNGKVTFKVRVIGSNGKYVGKNEVVLMKVAGKTYKVKTNAKGYASKTFSLTPGKYKITTLYKGSTVKNTITVKKVLKAKSKTVKKSKKIKYSATLKTSKGKAIKGKKVTFKIKGKTYSAKTNKKGVATVSFKNLKVGKYSVIVKYLKSQVKTTLKVKK
jgi:hypothetical protein